MPEFFQKGGPIMWLLAAASIIAVAAFLERAFYLHRASVRVGEVLRGLTNLIRIGNFAEAVTEGAATPGPIGRVIHSVVLRHDLSFPDLKLVAQDAGQLEMPRLERNLGLLASIVYVAPLLGLLGTVIGLIQAFSEISTQGGFTTVPDISSAIYQCLLSSAAGLAIATFALLAFQMLSARVNRLKYDMERAGIETATMILDWHRSHGQRDPEADL